MNFPRLILVIILLLQSSVIFATQRSDTSECSEAANRNLLKSGWYLSEPYQFNKVTNSGFKLTGMDIELINKITDKVGIETETEEVSWQQHQQDLKDGKRDIAAGATYTEARAKFAHFSIPYRFEENSLFVMLDNDKELEFDSISEYLAQVRIQNFRLGITSSFIYADPQINLFIGDLANSDIIFEFDNDAQALQALIKGEIDGFMSDRVVGAAAILNKELNSVVEEIQLNVKKPIHLMFSKKTVPLELVDKFNQEIKKFSDSDEYKEVIRTYLYPVMLMQTIDSQWFYMIGVIGTISFAISGVAIAARDNATLFGTFLFAMLPSVGGTIMRDVLTNRDEIGIFLTPSYMYYIIIVVLLGFSAVRLLEYYNSRAHEDNIISKFWDNILIIGDSLGQATFVVTGVSIVIMARIEPVELWGPFFAFLTANGGGIIRDTIRQKGKIICLHGAINAEVAVIWGLVFSIYLDINSHDPDADGIRSLVAIVVAGAFITRLLAYYLRIPNIKFRAEEKVSTSITAKVKKVSKKKKVKKKLG